MTAVPEDHWLLGIQPQPLTAEEYEGLPESVSEMIEVVDGHVVFCEAPTRRHQRAGRRLANLIERQASTAMRSGYGCVEVDTDVDLRLYDVPLTVRRPDVVLYRCLQGDERLRSKHVLLVVEIVSPGSEMSDTTDKFGEYAKVGIPHYWIVRLDDTGVSVIERYQLDRAAMLYKHTGTFMKDEGGAPEVGNPIPVTIDWAELEY
ncbi:hypothetical protein BJF79_24025 [Actinomadura sp. CNU-125]|uniref:Uma2 family endonuclease n=1 Tax=Actinomadura sp. CNU-125 TaxID=1904961 RepID=UPI00095B753B|nr:Uma2 family endonuclease [Actinomadura sp. CNU-125]OLT11548.1 hypothetical protein BJF79_24025 [Actinomadura sp. CNU-125]